MLWRQYDRSPSSSVNRARSRTPTSRSTLIAFYSSTGSADPRSIKQHPCNPSANLLTCQHARSAANSPPLLKIEFLFFLDPPYSSHPGIATPRTRQCAIFRYFFAARRLYSVYISCEFFLTSFPVHECGRNSRFWQFLFSFPACALRRVGPRSVLPAATLALLRPFPASLIIFIWVPPMA